MDEVPLAVDLDGTLLRTDTLIESLFVLARTRPLAMFKLPGWWLKGRAHLKEQLTATAMPEVALLPYRSDIVTFLRAQKAQGRTLVLATAADQKLAHEVARDLPLFDAVYASDGVVNLSGVRKRDRLVKAFGARGFDYLGDSVRDYPVWCSARRALLATPSGRLAARVAKATPVDVISRERGARWHEYLHALRPLHWVKNGLVFVPLAAIQRIFEIDLTERAVLAFLAFCLCASGLYLLNDLLDLPADRRHPHKKDRMLASGRVPLAGALLLLPLLMVGAFVIALRLSPAFAGLLGLYALLMIGYSMRLKDIALVDVFALAVGYALRIAGGSLATGVGISAWLLTFCVFLFFSLALIKRYAELMILQSVPGAKNVHARGYLDTDKMSLVAQGTASGYLAVVVLALYTNTDISHRLYPRHEYFWGICLLLMYWVSYLWLMVTRGRIHDDPVIFALADRGSRWTIAAMGLLAALASAAAPAADGAFASANSAAVAAAQLADYQAVAPKTIIELQPFRRTESVVLNQPPDAVTATLVDLNPGSNTWFLLTLKWPARGATASYHLENPLPKSQGLGLNPERPDGIQIVAGGHTVNCTLWQNGQVGILQQAQRADLPYAPLCDDHLFLRNAVAGSYTHLERVTNFLRDHVWGGEQIVGFVKQQFFADAFIEKGGAAGGHVPEIPLAAPEAPRAPLLAARFAAASVMPDHLGIDVGAGSNALVMGRWYPVHGSRGIFLSLIEPQAVGPPPASGKKSTMNPLDPVEAAAVDYLVAMDLAQFDLGFALGTDHPRVGWSERVLEAVRNPKLAGPDGIGSVSPLVVNGMVNPTLLATVAAAFAGGFKREHGAFRYGPLARQNQGTHYGFIEQGVVFSKLQPELATLIVTDDGRVQMRTWTAGDDARLPQIRFARQNGVPLIEYDEANLLSSPGSLVNNWGAGNWSGSEDERLRTLRAGLCIQVRDQGQYLIFGYFSTATPSAMARVFQAYGCRYAMHLDMNALEHTYFALYTLAGGRLAVQHLIDGMAEVDRKGGEELAPRFLSFPDDRDFFYLIRKKESP